jgi:hypothetical protein
MVSGGRGVVLRRAVVDLMSRKAAGGQVELVTVMILPAGLGDDIGMGLETG